MSALGAALAGAGAFLVICVALGAGFATIRRSTKDEIIKDQEFRIKQLEEMRASDREELAELRGQVLATQKLFTDNAIATISEGVVSIVAQMLIDKRVVDRNPPGA